MLDVCAPFLMYGLEISLQQVHYAGSCLLTALWEGWALTVSLTSFLLTNTSVLVGDFNYDSCVEVTGAFANIHSSPTSLFSVPAVVKRTNLAWNCSGHAEINVFWQWFLGDKMPCSEYVCDTFFSCFGISFHIGVHHEIPISGDLNDAERLRGVNVIARGW